MLISVNCSERRPQNYRHKCPKYTIVGTKIYAETIGAQIHLELETFSCRHILSTPWVSGQIDELILYLKNLRMMIAIIERRP